MAGILEKIVEHKKEEIATARKTLPESHLRAQAYTFGKRRPFLKILSEPGPSGINIIAEIKRASPSKGILNSALDPAQYAKKYEKGGAAALSILTDQTFFQGSVKDLKTARQATSLPVLRKDFLISSYQIYESSLIETDAVLLIAGLLTQAQLRDYLSLCSELELDALVEIHSEEDLKSATEAGAYLIGINNRNLHSFETHIETAVNMAPLIEPNQIAVAESGIHTRADIEKIKEAGIHNFLIGESLVTAPNSQIFLKNLMGFKNE
ncbi:MAG: indole-3-glycerol phosphate synthase TrpC [Desulfobacterales bacterium]|nr:indole-3-glycerol phosphate synthase TrpC [Desulfobacterales bacterium]